MPFYKNVAWLNIGFVFTLKVLKYLWSVEFEEGAEHDVFCIFFEKRLFACGRPTLYQNLGEINECKELVSLKLKETINQAVKIANIPLM